MFYFRVLFDQKLYKRIEQGLSSFASIMNELTQVISQRTGLRASTVFQEHLRRAEHISD